MVCRREPEKPLAEGELERIPRRLNPKANPAIEVNLALAFFTLIDLLNLNIETYLPNVFVRNYLMTKL